MYKQAEAAGFKGKRAAEHHCRRVGLSVAAVPALSLVSGLRSVPIFIFAFEVYVL